MKTFSMFFALSVSMLGAFTDIRYGKVSNKHLATAFVLWAAAALTGYLLFEQYVFTYKIITNILLSLCAVLFLYLKDIWAPGDAKLFIFTALVFPIQCYTCRDGNIFPSLNLIVFSFAFGYIYLIIQALRPSREDKIFEQREDAPFCSKDRLISVLSSMGIMTAIYFVFSCVAADFYAANRSLFTLLSVILLSLLQRKLPKIKNITGLVCLTSYIVLVMRYDIRQLLLTMVQSLAIALIIELFNRKITQNNYRQIEGAQVKPGMILSYGTIVCMKKCIDQELPRVTTEDRRTRLSEQQSEAVKLWCKNSKRPVIIVETIPFAPFIAAAELFEILKYYLLNN